MNYRLSTYADRVGKKVGFTLELKGKVISEKIFRFKGTNIKENALEAIYAGLCACRGKLKHDDVLIVEVQNIHLCNWLNGLQEYKDYNEGLDNVFAMLESIDCRYRFIFVVKPYVKGYMSGKGFTKVEVTSIDDFMSTFK